MADPSVMVEHEGRWRAEERSGQAAPGHVLLCVHPARLRSAMPHGPHKTPTGNNQLQFGQQNVLVYTERVRRG